MAKYIETLGKMEPDKLIAGNNVKFITGSGVIVSGAGKLRRGTVLGLNAAGKLAVLGGEGLTAHAILCDDVDASEADTVAEIYLTGQFNKNALIVAQDYTMTTADIQALRNGGIFLENSMAM